jgi:hypothetical protein
VVALPCRIQDPDRKGKVESGVGHTKVPYDSTLKTIRIVTDSSSFDLPQSVSDPIIGRVIEKLRRDRG